jgi:predicted nucleotidyltransferase
MRLSPDQISKIKTAIGEVDPNGAIYLFGSRVDDSVKGGDIDLFVESSYLIPFSKKLSLEWEISCLCDSDVDLLFKSPDAEEMPIHRIAKNGVKL